jgi:hypothetical protein
MRFLSAWLGSDGFAMIRKSDSSLHGDACNSPFSRLCNPFGQRSAVLMALTPESYYGDRRDQIACSSMSNRTRSSGAIAGTPLGSTALSFSLVK